MDERFAPILQVIAIMNDFPAPWFVAGGWAIDLFLEKVTRPHADVEIGIYRADQQLIWNHLPGWNLEKAITTPEGGKWVAWDRSEELQLPIHQIKANREDGPCREFEFFLNEQSGDSWMSRRHAGLTRPVETVTIKSFLGIPILSPEIQLLFKAKQTRDKDQADFDHTIDCLTADQINWLRDGLKRYHPEHQWIGQLEIISSC